MLYVNVIGVLKQRDANAYLNKKKRNKKNKRHVAERYCTGAIRMRKRNSQYCGVVELKPLVIRRFHIPHNRPCLPPKILHNLCFPFLLGITAVPRETEDNAYAKFWGANKVHYGGCGNEK